MPRRRICGVTIELPPKICYKVPSFPDCFEGRAHGRNHQRRRSRRWYFKMLRCNYGWVWLWAKTALSAYKTQSNAILELLQQVAQMSEALVRGEEVHVDFRV